MTHKSPPVTWRRVFSSLLGPDIPAHLREDFTLLTAHHMQGQARLMFAGFLVSLPMLVYGASPGAGPLVAYGLPAMICLLCVTALITLRRPLDAAAGDTEANRIIEKVWQSCLVTAVLGSIWCIASWASAPLEIRLYYPAIMSLGALVLGYCLMAVRSVGMTILLVTLGPVAGVLASTGETMDRVLALSILIAVTFQLVTMARHQRLLLSLVEERHRSGELARRDPLTGLCNRRALMERFEDFASRNAPVRLMVVDIDRFKSINDIYGHTMGDRVLQTLAGLLRSHVRGEICAARLGGEEFALLGTAEALDPAIALQLLREIGDAAMPHDEQITASIGVADAQVSSSSDWSPLYAEADRALYCAKKEGRNRVITHEPDIAAADGERALMQLQRA